MIRVKILAVAVAVWLAAGVGQPAFPEEGDTKPAARVLGPLSPRESLKHLQLHPACRMELVAAEPAVIDPVAIRFDEDGRLWVVEMRDYPHGPAKGEEPKSQIRILEDRDGDGTYETSRVFADKLLFVTGVQPWKGGAFVTLAGRVAYMKDTDGDGRADVDETWYTGFAQENSQLRANHPRFALDNHIYIANGLRGGKVVNARQKDAKPIDISGMDFRFNPLTGECEAVSGVGQFGLTFDDYGNRFVCSNRNPLKHIVLEQRYLKRNPNVAVPAVAHDVAAAGADSRIYPISRAWTTSNLHAGQFTAACGVQIYRGDALPKEFYGNGFTCDPTGNLVHREIIKPMGATFTSRPGREGIEFLASRDEWFRPVNLEVGPDGALYLVDMYRAVIEHPQFMPAELKTRPDLRLGDDRGRIWRIVAKGGKRSTKRPQLSKAKADTLVNLLGHPNAWWRETAQRLIVEHREKLASAELERILPDTKRRSVARIHAIWALQGLGCLEDGLLVEALRYEDTRVRDQALLLCEARMQVDAVRGGVLGVLRNPYAVRRNGKIDALKQPLLTSSFLPDRTIWEKENFPLLLPPDDLWLRQVVVLAVSQRASAVLATFLSGAESLRKNVPDNEGDKALVVDLAKLTRPEDTPRLLAAIVKVPGNKAWQDIRFTFFQTLAQTLVRHRSSLQAEINKLKHASLKAKLQTMLQGAGKIARNRNEEEALRVSAIDLLAYLPDTDEALLDLAVSEPRGSIRLRAIVALSRHAGLRPWQKLVDRFRRESPAVRGAIVNAVLARSDRTALLLDAIDAGRVNPAELDRTTVNRLLRHGDPEIRKRVQQLLADTIPADRKKVLADYQVVLKMKADPRRGSVVFKKNCANCHKIGEMGVNVAPDISDSRTKQAQQLLTDILQPNRAIDANYISYTIQTADGRTLNGIIDSESATSVTIKEAEGKTTTLLRSEIELMQSAGISLMPEGLEKNVPPQAMADLISFIKNWRYLDGRTPLGK